MAKLSDRQRRIAMAWDENKHPRDGNGQFTDGKETGYRQNTDYNEIVSDGKEEHEKSSSIDELLGEEFKGYKGQAAVDKLMKEKRGHVKGAFHREDIGDIDLLWGNDSLGLQHIVKRRQEQKIEPEKFLQDIAEIIQSGSFREKNDRGNFEFMKNGKVAVISPELWGNKIIFLLTAFKTHSKK